MRLSSVSLKGTDVSQGEAVVRRRFVTCFGEVVRAWLTNKKSHGRGRFGQGTIILLQHNRVAYKAVYSIVNRQTRVPPVDVTHDTHDDRSIIRRESNATRHTRQKHITRKRNRTHEIAERLHGEMLRVANKLCRPVDSRGRTLPPGGT